jgi:hypothetical protein
MKVVFKIIFATCLLAPAAHAEGVYFCTRDLLSDFFRSSEAVSYRKLSLTDSDKNRLRERLGYVPQKSSYTLYVAKTGERIDGYALIDEEKGEHQPITFAVKLSPQGVVERQEIVAYREAFGDEVRDARFRKQFVGKTVRDRIQCNDDIVAVSGATISSQAMAVGVRRAVILVDELVLRPVQAQATSTASRLN